jgi:cyanophycin synthetase
VFEDDDSLSLGAGSGSRTWPRAGLPLALDIPWSVLHDVPTVIVTGSNGKTTTTRLLAAMAQAASLKAGLCSTEGVVVGGRTLAAGDYAGPAGARAVLRQSGVDFAVLETARGGLLRRGLALRRADAAIVTNVSADHLGEYGIDSVEDIAQVKLVVAHAVAERGTLVLNGGDAALMAAAAQSPAVQGVAAAGRLALFASDHDHPALVALRARGGSTCAPHAGRLLLARGDAAATDLGAIRSLPLTLGGAAAYNLENAAAAVLAATTSGLPLPAVLATLQRFGAQPQDNPGRLERWPWRGATVLVDYAHNPDGLGQLLAVARALQAPGAGRLGLLLGQAGNRDDIAITELAHAASRGQPDCVVLKELPAMLRGRAPGSVPALLLQGLSDAGLPAGRCLRIDDEAAALRWLLDWAQPGDVLVLPVHTASVRQQLQAWLQAGG